MRKLLKLIQLLHGRKSMSKLDKPQAPRRDENLCFIPQEDTLRGANSLFPCFNCGKTVMEKIRCVSCKCEVVTVSTVVCSSLRHDLPILPKLTMSSQNLLHSASAHWWIVFLQFYWNSRLIPWHWHNEYTIFRESLKVLHWGKTLN